MIGKLRSIVQEVNAAKDLNSALDIMVARVKEAMQTEVCSSYLHDGDGHYVLMASEGLNPQSIGNVTLSLGDGLVGLVAIRAEPINLEQATAHPSYQYFPETGEEAFSSFLGVPIIHHRQVLGVLVVQQREQRKFGEDDEAFLVTMSAQLAGVIAHAEATGALKALGQQRRQAQFKGVGGSSGVAIGRAVVVGPQADLRGVPYKVCDNPNEEIEHFNTATEKVKEDIRRLGAQLTASLNRQEQALFDAYVAVLDDPTLIEEVVSRIRGGAVASFAWAEVILEHEAVFRRMSDPYLQERAADVVDLGRRVLVYLQDQETKSDEYPENAIIVGEELTASLLGDIPADRLTAMVSLQGSRNSHLAILARAMGVPTVLGAVDLPLAQVEGREIIVDGYRGTVYVDPDPSLKEHYQAIVDEEAELVSDLEDLKDKPCETLDNHRVTLWVNTGLMADVVRSLDRGAEGVGLYRTEVPFLMRDRFPTEEEQRKIYRDQLEAFSPKIVTMRTLDIGGDKALPYFPIEEANPFLGWRGIRVTLDHPELFLGQVRAMMKASEGLNNLRILLPMISGVPEFEGARALIYRAFHELIEEGYKIQLPKVGVMIEVPAAVYQARELAARADFLSIGSNDLTQYILAVDRNNAQVADLYDSLHPSVLRALNLIVREARIEGTSVSICGELAGDPAAAILLVAMGFDVLSMNATSLPRVKSVIRSTTLESAEQLLDEVLQQVDAHSVRYCLAQRLEEMGMNRLLGPREHS